MKRKTLISTFLLKEDCKTLQYLMKVHLWSFQNLLYNYIRTQRLSLRNLNRENVQFSLLNTWNLEKNSTLTHTTHTSHTSPITAQSKRKCMATESELPDAE